MERNISILITLTARRQRYYYKPNETSNRSEDIFKTMNINTKKNNVGNEIFGWR